jgi:hypothetical protein
MFYSLMFSSLIGSSVGQCWLIILVDRSLQRGENVG